MDFLLVVSGLALLLGAGDALVRGAVSLSLRIGVPALIVSLTVVAFGTSAPELLIAVQAALEDAPGIAMGNVVGSNVANVLLVLGVPALISTIDNRDCETMRSFAQMIFGSIVFIALCFLGPLTWWHGLILLGMLGMILWDSVAAARRHRRDARNCEPAPDLADELEDADPDMAWWKILGLLAAGLAGLPLGAHLLIDGARSLALDWGVSEAAIGLTLVAVGTSLPELATTVTAAIRKQADVALGNVIGSNIFNLVGIMGAAVVIAPIQVGQRFLQLDLWVMLASSLLLLPFVMRWLTMGRAVGAGLLALYVLYAASAFA
ncbi:calcium/sodium antiporter [Rhodovulum sp. DZ06]|uniref:calcium/sodium antiporter n=1 Tax=Rhodovulum sp. DZ06 TaxID=3425126 RepID=UPI003D34CD17